MIAVGQGVAFVGYGRAMVLWLMKGARRITLVRPTAKWVAGINVVTLWRGSSGAVVLRRRPTMATATVPQGPVMRPQACCGPRSQEHRHGNSAHPASHCPLLVPQPNQQLGKGVSHCP